MKRNTLFAIAIMITAVLLLCACNQDATDGIYSKVASSTESKDVVTRAYLGTDGAEYYYLSDKGIFKVSSSTALLEMADDDKRIIRGASIDGTDLYVLVQNTVEDDEPVFTANIFKTTLSSPSLSGDPLAPSYTGLTVNGIAYGAEGIYDTDMTTLKVSGTVNYHLETEEYAFFSVVDSDENYKFYIFKDGAVLSDFNGLEGDDTAYVAFQPIDTDGSDENFVLISNDSSGFCGHLLTATDGLDSTAWFTLKSSLPYGSSTQAASFLYTVDTSKFMAIKCNNYFDVIDVSDTTETPTVTPIATGFAQDIRTTEISNILETGDSTNLFVAGTYDSMLYLIDMTNATETSLADTTSTQIE